ADRQVLDREIDRLEDKGESDRHEHPIELAPAVELAGQQAGQRDHYKAEDRERYDEALVPFVAKTGAGQRVQVRRRPKQLAEVTLLSVAEAHHRRIAQHVEIERIALEG